MQAGFNFHNNFQDWDRVLNILPVESADIQVRGSTVGHHLPRGGEGLPASIKNIQAAGTDTYGTG